MLHLEKEKCLGCGMCVKHCYSAYLTMGREHPVLPENDCLNCGHCSAICPTKALTVVGNGYSEKEVTEYHRDTMNIDAKELLRFMQYRRSIRNYKPNAVPHALLEQVLEAGRYSPTIGNFQTLRYIVLEQEKMQYVKMAAAALLEGKKQNHPAAALFRTELIERIYHESHMNNVDILFHGAPAVILIADKQLSENGANTYIAASRMELMAQSLGLGTCYCGLFLRATEIDSKILEALLVPEGHQIYAALTIGYPEDQYLRTVSRKPVLVEWR